jgi:hypothetical protein
MLSESLGRGLSWPVSGYYSDSRLDTGKNEEIFGQGPVPVAARSQARTVFNRSNTGIVGSNHTRGMNMCPSCVVLYRQMP